MNERMRINPAEAAAAGEADALALLASISNADERDSPAGLLSNALSEIIGLAVENRLEECMMRLAGFCRIVGPVLAGPSCNAESALCNMTESEGGEL